jgi:MFS transporter, ACS family, tartrate transporter
VRRPALRSEEKDVIVSELQAELQAKKKAREYTIFQACHDQRIVWLSAAWSLAAAGYLGNIYWIPTFVKRLSGLPNQTVTTLLIIPALIGIAGMLVNSWHSDKGGERRLHSAVPLLTGAALYVAVMAARHNSTVSISFLLPGSGLFQAFYPLFWSMPTAILSESAAAASFGLINSL